MWPAPQIRARGVDGGRPGTTRAGAREHRAEASSRGLDAGRRRPQLRPWDRLLWSWLFRMWPRCRRRLVIVQPATAVRWYRTAWHRYRTWKSRAAKPVLDAARLLLPRPRPQDRDAPEHHSASEGGMGVASVDQRAAMGDRAALPDPRSGPFVRRRLHRASAADRHQDGVDAGRHAAGQGHRRTPCEGLRRECLDHIIVVDGRHLRYLLREFVRHDNQDRPHQTLEL